MSEVNQHSNDLSTTSFGSLGGKVILAGAGPGDPELLTIKALRYLQKADVVITDRLVSAAILQDYTREDALIIPVGKQCRKGASTSQSDINDLLVEHASRGKLVVRLKGGDASIFSNILDELRTLAAHQIPYEIIPGVTAALGAAAYAGIPLTARGYSTAVRFLTYYKQDILDESYWKDLAQTGDTLVFYMSSEPLDHLVEKLLQYGIGADKWLAVIEQATTPLQNIYNCPVHAYLPAAKGSSYTSPTLIIIGKVAALHEPFQWLPDSHSKEPYFAPVTTGEEPVIPRDELVMPSDGPVMPGYELVMTREELIKQSTLKRYSYADSAEA
jgi:uroporphyrin-III C-methyltransferase/precorrin-2 dehydrogenase/sirohydrochlorin ferrochelatase/uroporphyrin-III C-methyltransferase